MAELGAFIEAALTPALSLWEREQEECRVLPRVMGPSLLAPLSSRERGWG